MKSSAPPQGRKNAGKRNKEVPEYDFSKLSNKTQWRLGIGRSCIFPHFRVSVSVLLPSNDKDWHSGGRSLHRSPNYDHSCISAWCRLGFSCLAKTAFSMQTRKQPSAKPGLQLLSRGRFIHGARSEKSASSFLVLLPGKWFMKRKCASPTNR